MLATATVVLALAAVARSHTVAFVKGMYCENGTDPSNPNFNSNTPVKPLYNLTKADWWFQHDRGCDKAPPPPGVFLNLPAGGTFTAELAHNQAQTTLSYGGAYVSAWPDGRDHPDDWTDFSSPPENCLQGDGALHTQNETAAAGTAWAISYESDMSKVTMENLVVFSVLQHTPWKRVAKYSVPAALPACPSEGCTCAWLWVPKGCGQPNMYMAGYKCNVTGATSTTPLAVAKPPVYCADDASKCVKGAKQMIAWNQAEGNNIKVPPVFLMSPGYNPTCGFENGPQNDIFAEVSG